MLRLEPGVVRGFLVYGPSQGGVKVRIGHRVAQVSVRVLDASFGWFKVYRVYRVYRVEGLGLNSRVLGSKGFNYSGGLPVRRTLLFGYLEPPIPLN